MNGGLTQEQAASLLGVDPGDDPETVRRAYRTWARLAHPDLGGDARHFDSLSRARDVLLGFEDVHDHHEDVHDNEGDNEPAPRSTWAEVIVRPSPAVVLRWCLGAVVALALACLPAFLLGGGDSASDQVATLAIAAGPAAIAAAGWAVIVVRRLLDARADVGHRITALALTWLPLAGAQVVVAQIAGGSLIPVLPLLALPFVAAVAAVNPGAGLWQVPRRR